MSLCLLGNAVGGGCWGCGGAAEERGRIPPSGQRVWRSCLHGSLALPLSPPPGRFRAHLDLRHHAAEHGPSWAGERWGAECLRSPGAGPGECPKGPTGGVFCPGGVLRLLHFSPLPQNIGKSMSCQDFITNLQGLQDGRNFPKELLKVRQGSLLQAPRVGPWPWFLVPRGMQSSGLALLKYQEDIFWLGGSISDILELVNCANSQPCTY